jgi:cytochrome c5
MKKILTLVTLTGIVMFSVRCSSTKPASTSSSSEVSADAKIAEAKSKYSEAQMEEGKSLWQASCNKCHKLYDPASRTVGKWENVLPRMVKRAKLNDEQAGMVRAYLITHASAS